MAEGVKEGEEEGDDDISAIEAAAREAVGGAKKEATDESVVTLPPTLQLCVAVLKGLMRRREAQAAFNEPVDPVERDYPQYNEVVSHPTDLGTVKERLLGGYYTPDPAAMTDEGHSTYGPSAGLVCCCVQCVDAVACVRRKGRGEAGFVSDVRLVFNNTSLYAQPETSVFKMVRSRFLLCGVIAPYHFRVCVSTGEASARPVLRRLSPHRW